MTDRESLRTLFLERHGWAQAVLTALPGDASFRRYFRLLGAQGQRAMLMDAPPPQEDIRPFLHIAKLLHQFDYSAPRILAADETAGFIVLEDLGDATYTRVIAAGGDERPLYALATEVLADLHQRFDPATDHGVPPYSLELLLREAALLTDWFLPASTGQETPEALRRQYLALWEDILPLAQTVPSSLVLRDYHIDNLMFLPDRNGLAACGLLDFQDAVIGPISYDLVSLLEDARRDIPLSLITEMRQLYRERRPELDPAALDRSLAILGAQRHAKVIGIFCRLAIRDHKPVYLVHLPRVWRLLNRCLQHPALAPLAQWFNAHIPPALQGIPPRLLLRVEP